tara:strand:+ start:83 stop:250 length:168 start_codon:yes stop_codon:yes gene_type:complete
MDREKTRKRFMKWYGTLKAKQKKEMVETMYKTLTDKFVKELDECIKFCNKLNEKK